MPPIIQSRRDLVECILGVLRPIKCPICQESDVCHISKSVSSDLTVWSDCFDTDREMPIHVESLQIRQVEMPFGDLETDL